MVRAAIFDMDGTLLDTESIWHQSWQLANEEFELGIDDNLLRSFIGMPKQTFMEMQRKIFPSKIDMYAVSKRRYEYYQEYVEKNGIKIKPGVSVLLNYLQNKKIRLAVCTSTFEELAIPALKIAGLYECFELIVMGDGIKKGKPNPEIYLKTLKMLNEKAENCIAFEDSMYGVQSAVNAGIKTYFIKDINDLDEYTYSLIHRKLNTIDEVIEEI